MQHNISPTDASIQMRVACWSDQTYPFNLMSHHPFEPNLLLLREFDFGLVLAVQGGHDLKYTFVEPVATILAANPELARLQCWRACLIRQTHKIRNFVSKPIGHFD